MDKMTNPVQNPYSITIEIDPVDAVAIGVSPNVTKFTVEELLDLRNRVWVRYLESESEALEKFARKLDELLDRLATAVATDSMLGLGNDPVF